MHVIGFLDSESFGNFPQKDKRRLACFANRLILFGGKDLSEIFITKKGAYK
jgi:hypothetical protein